MQSQNILPPSQKVSQDRTDPFWDQGQAAKTEKCDQEQAKNIVLHQILNTFPEIFNYIELIWMNIMYNVKL